MRRLTGWILLALLVHATMLVFPAAHLFRHHVRQTMWRSFHGRHDQRTVRFSFQVVNGEVQEPGFAWEEEGHEFVLNGTLYDVASIAFTDDRCVVECVADRRESIAAQLVKLFAPEDREEAGTGPGGAVKLNLRLDPFVLPQPPIEAVGSAVHQGLAPDRHAPPPSFVGAVPTPPPRA